MRPYEIVVIFDASKNDGEIRKSVDRITNGLKADGADIRNVDLWGRRRLAYEIDHKTEAYYILIELRAEAAAVIEADRSMLLADDVIRHKIIRIPEHIFGKAPTVRPTDDSNADIAPEPRERKPRAPRRTPSRTGA